MEAKQEEIAIGEEELEALKRILTHLVEEGKISFTDEDLDKWDIDSDAFEVLRKNGIIERVEPLDYYCENCTYIITPQGFKFDDEDENFFAFMVNHGWVFLEEKEWDELIARWLYEKYADGFEFVDEDNYGYVAWWLYRVFASYDIEADEKIDRYDYRFAYKGPIFYRFGSKWLVRDVDYCNTNRWETASGIFKGATYSIIDNVPPEE